MICASLGANVIRGRASSTMSDANVTPSNSGMVPVLTRTNCLKWQMCVRAYLTPYDHVCHFKKFVLVRTSTILELEGVTLASDMSATVVEAGVAAGAEAGGVAETGAGVDAGSERVTVGLVVGTDVEGWLITCARLGRGGRGKRPWGTPRTPCPRLYTTCRTAS